MEFIIELLLDLVIEGSIELSSNNKTPKWLRYPLAIFIILFFTIVIIGLFILGIFILNKDTFAGIFVIAVSLVMAVSIIIKVRMVIKEKHLKK